MLSRHFGRPRLLSARGTQTADLMVIVVVAMAVTGSIVEVAATAMAAVEAAVERPDQQYTMSERWRRFRPPYQDRKREQPSSLIQGEW